MFRRCQRSAVEEMPAVGEGLALLCSDAASAACWSASGIARCATFLPLTHGRPPTVRVPMAGAFASRLTTGGLRPPLLYCGANVCRRKNDFFDAHTHIHKSGGRQPAVGVGKMFTQTKARLFGRPPRVRVPMAVAFASRENTGADAPRSW